MRMCAKNRLRVTVGAPYIFAERVPEAVGPPKMEREESEDAMEAVHDDAFPAHALPGGVAAAVPRVDAIVASRMYVFLSVSITRLRSPLRHTTTEQKR